MPKLLYLVDKTNPILREIMPDVQNFSDPKLKAIIEDMCFSILPAQLKQISDSDSAAGMAANQWGIKKRVFIYTPAGSAQDESLTVMLNPSYEPIITEGETEPTMVSAYEACFSIPHATGLVTRYHDILATYFDESGKKIEMLLHGFAARVFQHETDHLNGKLYDGQLDNYPGPMCTERIQFKNAQEMDDFFDQKVRPNR